MLSVSGLTVRLGYPMFPPASATHLIRTTDDLRNTTPGTTRVSALPHARVCLTVHPAAVLIPKTPYVAAFRVPAPLTMPAKGAKIVRRLRGVFVSL